MGTKLYVGNLNYRSTEDGLHAIFSSSGRQVVSVKIITDRETGQSRGFAFVEMATSEDASGVMDEVNGQVLDGRTLKVTEARDRVPGGGGPGGPGGPRGGFGGPGGGGGGGGGRPRFGDGGRQGRPVEREYVGGGHDRGGHGGGYDRGGHGGGHGGHDRGGHGGGFGGAGRQPPFDPHAVPADGRNRDARRERRENRGSNAYERDDEEE